MLSQSSRRLIFPLTYSKSQIFFIPKPIFYQTVKETEKYSEFVPWCTSSTIKQRLSQNQNYTTLTISFNELKHISYTSHVLIQQKGDLHTITSICREYPLKQLKSVWTMRRVSQVRTEVDYSLDFQFDSLIYQLTSSIFLDIMGKSMWNVFVARAKKRHQLQRNKQESLGSPSKHFMQHMFTPPNEPVNECRFDALQDYLIKRPYISNLYHKRSDLKRKIDTLSQRFTNTNDFEKKMDFQLHSLFINENISWKDRMQ